MRWPVAIPTSRSAAVKRGLAASARASASLIVRAWEYDVPVSHGLARNAAAHARRVTVLTNIKEVPDEPIDRALGAPKTRSGRMFRRRRIEPRMIFQEEHRRRKRQRRWLRRRLGNQHR